MCKTWWRYILSFFSYVKKSGGAVSLSPPPTTTAIWARVKLRSAIFSLAFHTFAENFFEYQAFHSHWLMHGSKRSLLLNSNPCKTRRKRRLFILWLAVFISSFHVRLNSVHYPTKISDKTDILSEISNPASRIWKDICPFSHCISHPIKKNCIWNIISFAISHKAKMCHSTSCLARVGIKICNFRKQGAASRTSDKIWKGCGTNIIKRAF